MMADLLTELPSESSSTAPPAGYHDNHTGSHNAVHHHPGLTEGFQRDFEWCCFSPYI